MMTFHLLSLACHLSPNLGGREGWGVGGYRTAGGQCGPCWREDRVFSLRGTGPLLRVAP